MRQDYILSDFLETNPTFFILLKTVYINILRAMRNVDIVKDVSSLVKWLEWLFSFIMDSFRFLICCWGARMLTTYDWIVWACLIRRLWYSSRQTQKSWRFSPGLQTIFESAWESTYSAAWMGFETSQRSICKRWKLCTLTTESGLVTSSCNIWTQQSVIDAQEWFRSVESFLAARIATKITVKTRTGH